MDPKHAKVPVEERFDKGARPVKTPGAAEGAGIRTPAEHRHDRCARGEECVASEEQAGGELAAERRPDRHIRSEETAGNMSSRETTKYTMAATRLIFLAADRPDIACAAKEKDLERSRGWRSGY